MRHLHRAQQILAFGAPDKAPNQALGEDEASIQALPEDKPLIKELDDDVIISIVESMGSGSYGLLSKASLMEAWPRLKRDPMKGIMIEHFKTCITESEDKQLARLTRNTPEVLKKFLPADFLPAELERRKIFRLTYKRNKIELYVKMLEEVQDWHIKTPFVILVKTLVVTWNGDIDQDCKVLFSSDELHLSIYIDKLVTVNLERLKEKGDSEFQYPPHGFFFDVDLSLRGTFEKMKTQ